MENREENHSRFSPSSSKKWLTCTKSMMLPPREVKQNESSHANRGTAIHAMCEDLLLTGKSEKEYSGYTPTEDDVAGTVEPYVNYILGLKEECTHSYVEKKVFIHEECYGTADFVGFNEKTGTLHVADLKAGQGVFVDVENNTQLRIYAIGALNFLYAEGHGVQKIVTHVIQPGMNNIASEEVEMIELKRLRTQIHDTIEKINEGEGEFAPSEDACRWCEHKTTCPELTKMANKIAANDFEGIDLAEKMQMIPVLKLFIKSVEEDTFKALDQGTKVPGFKMIEGRGSRKWQNAEGPLNDLIKMGLPKEKLTAPSTALSVAQMEKLLKKEKITDFELAGYIVKKPGAPKVAPQSAKGKEYIKVEKALEDFKDL